MKLGHNSFLRVSPFSDREGGFWRGVCIDGKGVFDKVQFSKGPILIAVLFIPILQKN